MGCASHHLSRVRGAGATGGGGVDREAEAAGGGVDRVWASSMPPLQLSCTILQIYRSRTRSHLCKAKGDCFLWLKFSHVPWNA